VKKKISQRDSQRRACWRAACPGTLTTRQRAPGRRPRTRTTTHTRTRMAQTGRWTGSSTTAAGATRAVAAAARSLVSDHACPATSRLTARAPGTWWPACGAATGAVGACGRAMTAGTATPTAGVVGWTRTAGGRTSTTGAVARMRTAGGRTSTTGAVARTRTATLPKAASERRKTPSAWRLITVTTRKGGLDAHHATGRARLNMRFPWGTSS
jgi:hypothetical protein